MHVFFESVWKLHIGEIPEKPELKPHYLGNAYGERRYKCLVQEYNEAIAAIKQNALTVGNPGVIASKLDSLEWVGRIDKADVYKWPGGYKTKETPENRDGRLVAILKLPNGKYQNKCCNPLPEEKKNTMENMTKEQELTEAEKFLIKKSHEYPPFTHGGLNQLPYLFVSAVAKCMEEFVQFSLYKDHPTTSSGSVAAPTWYTENEMYHWLIRNNYHENIARELSSKWAADLQGAFNKGFEKGTREIKEREEALKELLSLAVRYKNTVNFTTREDEFDRTQAIIERARKLISK